MKPMQILIMRHGESLEDTDVSVYDRLDDDRIGLTSNGREQCRAAANELSRWLPSERVRFYCSPSLKVTETADEMIRALPSVNAQIIRDARIIKQDWGHVTAANRRQIEISRYQVGVLNYHFPGGESGAQLLIRVGQFVQDFWASFDDPDFPETAIIITHGFEMRVVLMLLLGWGRTYFEQIAHPTNCYIARLLLQQDGTYTLTHPMRLYDPTRNSAHVAKSPSNNSVQNQ